MPVNTNENHTDGRASEDGSRNDEATTPVCPSDCCSII